MEWQNSFLGALLAKSYTKGKTQRHEKAEIFVFIPFDF